ncbi:hypothetical protein [Methylotetracoccus oryzae]|uniref:hypothetical protein n=1 Tax=Methylotetracoccus oryzae TaxID=1919059 RepID=UPI00111B45BF|nr:hypothetical protein [Methylotetracoccus oryzae]
MSSVKLARLEHLSYLALYEPKIWYTASTALGNDTRIRVWGTLEAYNNKCGLASPLTILAPVRLDGAKAIADGVDARSLPNQWELAIGRPPHKSLRKFDTLLSFEISTAGAAKKASGVEKPHSGNT